MLIEYVDTLLGSRFKFFMYALPLVLLFFLLRSFRDMWDEGTFVRQVFDASGILLVRNGSMTVRK